MSMTITITTLKMLMMVTMGNQNRRGRMTETVNMGVTAVIATTAEDSWKIEHHVCTDSTEESLMKRPGEGNWQKLRPGFTAA